MSQTAQAVVQNLVDRAVKLGDRQLAADIRAFAAQRQFGLVFEHNRPERLRLYGKPIMEGDVVQVLPERGKKEDSSSQLLWLVNAVRGGVADLEPYQSPSYDENECEPRSVAVDDVVPVAEYDQPIYAGLKETGRVERGGDKPYQVVINGENYHALETLAFAYAGKADCIYIDPPYNTGARDWKYNNDYVDGSDAYRHSKWLAFMERRLKLAKQLLNPNESVLIVTIDEKEYLRLGLLLEQVFANASSMQMITSVTNPSGSSRAKTFARAGEYIYILFFGEAAPERLRCDMLHEPVGAKKIQWEGYIRRGATRLRSDRPNMFYPIYFSLENGSFHSFGDVVPLDVDYKTVEVPKGCFAVWPVVGSEERYWRLGKDSSESIYKEGFIKFGPWKKGSKKRSVYYLPEGTRKAVKNGDIQIIGRADDGSLILDAVEKDVIPLDIWNRPSHSAADYGTPLVSKILGGRKFPFPKSLYAVEDTIRFFVTDKPDALVVDFFSGSGTTAHAVMRLNHQDGGRRRSISVTNNEVSEDESKKLTKRGLRQGDPEWEALGICQYVTKPRVTAAITGKTPEGDSIKGDYKFTDEFPMANGFEENAVFFDLTYEDPDAVELGVAFEEIAPLLWLRAGSRGSIIKHEQPGFAMADAYAVLFDFASVGAFIDAVKQNASIGCAYVITDDTARYASVKAQLPGLDVVRLYENYLQSFKIAAEDAVR